jgi:hypothetical protein
MNFTWLRAVRRAKTIFWETKISNADTNGIWDIHKRHTRTHTCPIPDFDNASSFTDKVNAFRIQFFSTNSPVDDISLIKTLSSASDQSHQYEPVNVQEITDALKKSNVNASVGQDQANTRTIAMIHQADWNLLP